MSKFRAAVVLPIRPFAWSFVLWVLAAAGAVRADEKDLPFTLSPKFPANLVRFQPYAKNPVFTAQEGAWDTKIRERGWIMKGKKQYRMWYTGYDGDKRSRKLLGMATSADGIHWTRSPKNPLLSELWIEDMMVVQVDDLFYMFAEGENDQAHLLTSPDGIAWTSRGQLKILTTEGKPITPGPFGTPTAWHEGGIWWLFYERGDQGVWLAKSTDLEIFTNVQDEPVLTRGPEAYDQHAIAVNQIIREGDRYYAYYHASDSADWKEWSTCVATSMDLIHWEKYAGNPIVKGNRSSGIVVPAPADSDKTQGRFWLYTMHGQVDLFQPVSGSNK